MALLIQSQAQLDSQLEKAKDNPVVVAFTLMSHAQFAAMYSEVVKEFAPKTDIVFLLVMVNYGPAGQKIADKAGVGDLPTFLFYLNKELVTSFSDPEAQAVVDTLENKLKEFL